MPPLAIAAVVIGVLWISKARAQGIQGIAGQSGLGIPVIPGLDDLSNLTGIGSTDVEQLMVQYNGKRTGDIPISVRQLFTQHNRSFYGPPTTVGHMGWIMGYGKPGGILLARWNTAEWQRDLAGLNGDLTTADPNAILLRLEIQGQKHYGFIDRAAGDIKKGAGAILGGVGGFFIGGPAGAAAGASTGMKIGGKI